LEFFPKELLFKEGLGNYSLPILGSPSWCVSKCWKVGAFLGNPSLENFKFIGLPLFPFPFHFQNLFQLAEEGFNSPILGNHLTF